MLVRDAWTGRREAAGAAGHGIQPGGAPPSPGVEGGPGAVGRVRPGADAAFARPPSPVRKTAAIGAAAVTCLW
jgi:hypothetical protein